MPLMLYTVVFFFLLCLFGLFWYLQSGSPVRDAYVSPLFGDHEKNLTTEDLSLLLGLKRIEHLADRGRWLLFISVLLLVIEFFAVLAMLIESRGQMYVVSAVNHGYVIGGFIYLLVSVLAVIFSVRLVSAEKSLSIANPFERIEAWEHKVIQADAEQKKRIVLYLNQESGRLEGYFAFVFGLVGCGVTLLMIWVASWLTQFVR
ncbi:hypothetical protein [Turneriella parva]|uniref:Uncharacterized protein n=1 Tax=Turneriella parva (strain ATCC BAA-1111 / DSM 21527 / NCTC 11395 / H) TaxID=869212 RepID=I4BC06_TURPD|nr:hypothetical protein [Turneriella parva]AFM14813.1 hypothetical protein Turpa_0011 [Turneriella parva DSM 21527]